MNRGTLDVIDTAYMCQNRMFARDRDGTRHAAIVVSVLGVSATLIGYYL